ncbi:acyl--CoA ligase [Aspergillus fijiensis CBS 313.89]|uniref:Acetyl-CoA synthetase-like protein n=1 Tax=Aspergillus fijiensis CBS 313.89 TaxID=1448319 RepID=A0A8G1RNA9_9EURO|nr:acetyl-CoA synthetase-like protein [Aspergillus fijiensis CBS 313.89]RAK75884.1 acetyl-CoA synthetase-like protein [Aspergillus fijiensis CBS 313.89]
MSMIFKPERQLPLPTTDILSYIFGDPEYDPNEPIYIDAHNPTHTLSCNGARKMVKQLIRGLQDSGLEPGDCVVIHSFNNIYYSVLVLAIIGAGGVFTGTNPSHTTSELVHHLRVSKARFIISEADLIVPILEAARQVNLPEGNSWVLDTYEASTDVAPRNDLFTISNDLSSWRTLLTHGEAEWQRFDTLTTARDTTAARFLSSGTTGLPKAVDITHYNLVAQHTLVFEAHPRPYRMTSLIALPVFHAAIAPLVHIGALRSGYTMYIMRRFELGSYLRFVKQYAVTDLIVVPPILTAILASDSPGRETGLKKVRNVVCGAAPLDKDTQSRVERELLPEGVPLTQGWGMTETCCAAMMLPYPEVDDTGSVGRLVPNVEAKLIDDNGENISAYDVPGELCIRGPTVTPGYHDNPAANESAFGADGWLKTGDVAICDGVTRKWYIVDRKKELIKVRGFQVAPSELEAVLLSHPAVVDAAVVGVCDPLHGSERPRAFVVAKPGEPLRGDEVRRYAAERLAGYKEISGGVRVVEAIPRNASGKILRRVLRGLAECDAESRRPVSKL